MSVSVKELRRSRSLSGGTQPSARLEYIVYGTSDPEAAEFAVYAHAPAVYAGLVLDQVDIEPQGGKDDVFTSTVRYRKAVNQTTPDTNTEEVTFDLSSQTAKVTQSLATVARYPANAPDFEGGMGWNGQAFEGAEIFVEQFSFAVTKYVPRMQVTNAFIKQLRDVAFHVNDGAWRGFAAGEVMFVGLSGSPRSDEDYTLSFKFLTARNRTGLEVGSVTGIAAKGWEHIWTLYEKEVDGEDNYVVQIPRAVYVESNYPSANFSTSLPLSP